VVLGFWFRYDAGGNNIGLVIPVKFLGPVCSRCLFSWFQWPYVGPGIYALINHGIDTVIGTGIGSLLSGVGTGTGLLSRYCFW